jgi:hypothetical protein
MVHASLRPRRFFGTEAFPVYSGDRPVGTRVSLTCYRVDRAETHVRETCNKECKLMKKIVIAATTFACAAILSVSYSDQRGVSLGVQGAQAAPAKTSHMMHHSRGHMGRGYARGPVDAGANVAAGAVNTAGAIAFGAINTAGAIATAPFGGPGWNDSSGWNGGYYQSSSWGDYECRPGGRWACRPNAERWAQSAQSGPSYTGGRRDMSRPGGRGVSRKPAS